LTAHGEKPSVALSRAVANLLRLASSDIKDAELLASGRHPENAPLLIHVAARRMIESIIATERGWPVDPNAVEFSKIPDQNPAKLALARISKLALPPKPVALLPDGRVPKTFDNEAFRQDAAAVRKILQDLAERFDVDLLGDGPAKRAARIRPVPSVAARKVIEKPLEIVTSAGNTAREPPPTVQSKPSQDGTIRRIAIPDTRVGRQAPTPREVESRSPLVVSSGRHRITSAAFWQLMDRWNIPDLAAFNLIGHRDSLSKKRTRRRFRLIGEEGERVILLFEIDQAISSLRLDPKIWMNKPIQGAPFGGAKPIEYLTKYGIKGFIATSRYLFKNGLQLSMSSAP